jgi:hypothetical protein
MKHFPSRTYSLVLHADAELDLDKIYKIDENAAAEIEAILQEIGANQEMLETLTIRNFVRHGNISYDVKEWEAVKRSAYNLWRLRLLYVRGASQYRIVYAFHTVEFRYYVLAVLDRNFNYSPTHERTKRILSLYESLDIPRH